jgi:hypothetical protein
VIWLRPWKELILRMLRGGSGGWLRGFLAVIFAELSGQNGSPGLRESLGRAQ